MRSDSIFCSVHVHAQVVLIWSLCRHLGSTRSITRQLDEQRWLRHGVEVELRLGNALFWSAWESGGLTVMEIRPPTAVCESLLVQDVRSGAFCCVVLKGQSVCCEGCVACCVRSCCSCVLSSFFFFSSFSLSLFGHSFCCFPLSIQLANSKNDAFAPFQWTCGWAVPVRKGHWNKGVLLICFFFARLLSGSRVFLFL